MITNMSIITMNLCWKHSALPQGSGIVFIFTLCLATQLVSGLEDVLTGYHFMDNQLEKRFGPDNGYATFNTGKPIPDQVTFLFYMHLGFLWEEEKMFKKYLEHNCAFLGFSNHYTCVEQIGMTNIRHYNRDQNRFLVVLSEISGQQIRF